MKETNEKLTATAKAAVDKTNTAKKVKSGSLEVFSTPMLLAVMEEATCNAVKPILEKGETTVGTKVSITHDKASGTGEIITAHASLEKIDKRRLTFEVYATDESGDTIGKGIIERFVVNEERFMERVNK